jgi:hypothetical protein
MTTATRSRPANSLGACSV